MSNNQGFISIIVLLVMSIIIISATFLTYTWNLECLIFNSSKNAIQASYLAESKIHMALNKEDYFYCQLLPRIERYLKYGRLAPNYDYKIRIDKKDLFEGDQNKNIEINFSDDKRFMELKTHSICDGIKKQATAKIILINQFFDMGLPIVSKSNIEINKLKDYYDYLDYLQKEIAILNCDNDLIGIEARDFENIKIIKGIDEKINVEFFRNNFEKPIKTQVLNGNKAFLIAKNSNLNPPTVSILSENNIDKVAFNGILYIEGNLEIHNDVDFNGILIINEGKLFINPLTEVKLEGIVLMKDHAESIENSDRIEINFNIEEIIKYGVYLPKFIDPKIEIMKIN